MFSRSDESSGSDVNNNILFFELASYITMMDKCSPWANSFLETAGRACAGLHLRFVYDDSSCILT